LQSADHPGPQEVVRHMQSQRHGFHEGKRHARIPGSEHNNRSIRQLWAATIASLKRWRWNWNVLRGTQISCYLQRTLIINILWRIWSLLGNDSVYTFQRTLNNRNCVLCGPQQFWQQEVFSIWSEPCPVLGSGAVNTHP
jgi:hypothetical protein